MVSSADTIFALSSGSTPSGVAVIRLSGPTTRDVLHSLTGRTIAHRTLMPATLRSRQGIVLDRGMVAFFEAPRSHTGEDCGELHLHGGRAVVAAMLRDLSVRSGLRLAEAGEFTRRAFLNGKLDLTSAEALADLIDAETEQQRILALGNAHGLQRDLYDGWRAQLVQLRALVEARLDFSDEADVRDQGEFVPGINLRDLAGEIRDHLATSRQGEIIREGFRVVLLGRTNAGKSSLLNKLAQREAAIVTAVPGTTRDLIEVPLDLDGHKVIVTDTAGLRASEDEVERIGIRKARQAAESAHLIVLLDDASNPGGLPASEFPRGVPVLTVTTKIDLFPARTVEEGLGVSSLSGQGFGKLTETITRFAREASATAGGAVPTRERHLFMLRSCLRHLESAEDGNADLTLMAEELRLASDALGRITGAVDVEEVLGAIFSRFCIGK